MPCPNQAHTAFDGALAPRITGYALREAIRHDLGLFWPKTFGQVYPSLARLEREGLVENVDAPRARSARYATTQRGRDQLRDRLAEAPQPQKLCNGTPLRLFVGRQLGVDGRCALVEQSRKHTEQQLARLAAVRASLAADESLRDEAPFILMTVSAEESSVRTVVVWADERLPVLADLLLWERLLGLRRTSGFRSPLHRGESCISESGPECQGRAAGRLVFDPSRYCKRWRLGVGELPHRVTQNRGFELPSASVAWSHDE